MSNVSNSSSTSSAPSRLQTFPLGFPWRTIDPFLFCVHHVDDYPNGNEALGPAASLEGREIGNDFAGIDGWRMYHGDTVPGFPQHPHRGFETVTYVRKGFIDHSDSLGATARYGRGDVQWLTAGSGIVHSETFPLVERDSPNPVELFQVWLNLAGADKMAEPYFEMLWDEDIPRFIETDESGRTVAVTVIAGEFRGRRPPPPPPRSWASKADSDVAIWHLSLDAGTRLVLPPARSSEAVRTLYLYAGDSMTIGDERLEASTAAVIPSDHDLAIEAQSAIECLVLQGRPIGEPVAQYGPFVMNDRAGIEQAFDDYRRTGFGGWPWTNDEPVHDRGATRFARRPDGRIDTPSDQAESPSN